MSDVNETVAVPRGAVCAEHSALMQSIGRIEATLAAHEKRGEEIQQTQREIFALLRQQNDRAAAANGRITGLQAEVHQQTLNAATIRAGVLSIAATAAWEAMKRAFHL